jgi:ureidoglycolate lyase
MTREIFVEPLSATTFAAFGDVIDTQGAEPFQINDGYALRFDDLAALDLTCGGGKPCVSIFRAVARSLPITIRMLERHPLGSQAFIPLSGHDYLVVVALAEDSEPFESVRAFRANPTQGVNYHRGVWHHPLLALNSGDDFLVIDRKGSGNNLQEMRVDPIQVDTSKNPLLGNSCL